MKGISDSAQHRMMPVLTALSPSPEDRRHDKHIVRGREDQGLTTRPVDAPFFQITRTELSTAANLPFPVRGRSLGQTLDVFFVILPCTPVMQTVDKKLAFRQAIRLFKDTFT